MSKKTETETKQRSLSKWLVGVWVEGDLTLHDPEEISARTGNDAIEIYATASGRDVEPGTSLRVYPLRHSGGYATRERVMQLGWA